MLTNEIGNLHHPLLNNLILDNIFDKGQWSVEELKTFRRVCSAWYDATLNIWKTTACVVLIGSENETNSPNPIVKPGSEVFKRYIDYRNDFTRNCTLKYKTMCNYKLMKCKVDERNEDLKSFLETFSSHMKHLSIEECFFRKPSTFENLVYIYTPNVECLMLNSNKCGYKNKAEKDFRLERHAMSSCSFNRRNSMRTYSSSDIIRCDLNDEANVEVSDGDGEGSASDEAEDNVESSNGVGEGSESDEDVEGSGGEDEESTSDEDDRMWQAIRQRQDIRQTKLENPKEVQTKLKSLQIKNEKYLTWQISLTSFLAHFPNLEELKTVAWHGGCIKPLSYTADELWEALNNCRRTNKTRLNIKKLDIMYLRTDAISGFGTEPRFVVIGGYKAPPIHGGFKYIDIGDASLPLEHLSIDVAYSGTKYLDYVVKSHAATLQVLKLFRAPYANSELGLPTDIEMPSLKELHLFGELATDFCFLETMPNLRVLYIERWCYTKRDKISLELKDEKNKPSKNMNHLLVKRSITKKLMLDMEHLEELDVDTELDLESLNTLAGWMPNLKIARLILTNETLDAVINGWPGLTDLTVKFESDVDDEGIKKLVELTHLRKFKLEAYCNKSQLTDESVELFGIMGHLTDLEICVSEQMSEKSEQQLISKLRKVKIVRNYGEGDHDYECCSRVQFHEATRAYSYKDRKPVVEKKKR